MVKRDYFSYFTQGTEITIDAIQLYAIKANTVQSATLNLNSTTLTTNLKDNGEFELSLTPDAVLERKLETHVFVLIKYSLASV